MIDQEQKLERIGEKIAGMLGEGPDRAEVAAQRAALIASSHRSTARRRLTRAAQFAAGLLIVAAAAAFAAAHLRTAPMQFRIGDGAGQGAAGGWFVNDGSAPLRISFDDGSSMRVLAGTQGRVLEATSRDVRVLLDDGSLDADIRSAGRTRWVLDAGPYRVRVTGTEFNVRWHRTPAALDVAVSRGAVVVDGIPGHASGLALAEGRRLTTTGQTVQITAIAAPATAEALPGRAGETPATAGSPLHRQAPTAGIAAASPARGSEMRTARAGKSSPLDRPDMPPAETWLQLYRSSRYREALDAALEKGFDGLLEALDVDDLWALAESARYAQDLPRARAALETLRRRFPESGPARTAAFLLGRLALESDRLPVEGARWFRVYLHELPDGPLGEEAMGRLIDALLKAGQSAEARAVAQGYLRRHPTGAFAEFARSVVKD